MADVNGDGKADLIFVDAGGDLAAWTLDGTEVTGGGTIGAPGAQWHLIG